MTKHTHWRTHEVSVDSHEDRAALIGREWLLTNGTGAYSMGTAAGANTRRYHGLLVAAAHPPVGRVVVLNQMFEQLILHPRPRKTKEGAQDDQGDSPRQTLEFSTCLFTGGDGQRVYAPQGFAMLSRFERGLTVSWTYQWGDITLTRELLLHWKQQAATIRYTISGLAGAASGASLALHPMVTLRDFHGLCHCGQGEDFGHEYDRGRMTLRRRGRGGRGDIAATIACEGSRVEERDQWWYGVQYPIEAERGQENHEDYYVPAALVCDLEVKKGQSAEVALTVALGEKAAKPQGDAKARAKHLEGVEGVVGRLAGVSESKSKHQDQDALVRCMAIAADDFVVDRKVKSRKLSTIIAGYPWFADWGRDTFIAMRGLLLTTGRHDEARDVLAAFAAAIRDGLVPNRFDDYQAGEAHYNTVDASLWFIQAALDYVKAAGDQEAWKDWLAEACVSIVEAYIHGTGDKGDGKSMIVMTSDGLITAGTDQTQLTWMDAADGDHVFTPRQGKAVEICALWYNALMCLSEKLPKAFSKQAEHYKKLAGRAKRSFAKVFWDEEKGYLADHVWEDGGGQTHVDRSLRPNQIFAASLEVSPLPVAKQKKVLAAVKEDLLTPVGLKTLPFGDPNYHGRYAGNQFVRDEAYHQGTIWPWLIGPYAEAVLRTGKFSKAAWKEAMEAIAPLLHKVMDVEASSLGQLAEIHEADPPERAVGCMAQAWSVGEVLRVWGMAKGGNS